LLATADTLRDVPGLTENEHALIEAQTVPFYVGQPHAIDRARS
jgi:hypothetical protein